ncbi:hypothetical protein FDP41_005249 [Naegleria fowleri]|uniref:Uncharacterized protein n=1 Tax=Naegleria fowleri TaxID=5763 RepID=A0A6A5BM32_NAEFO|nr:uncharacterized protein FDP41_005249 [Naegleria fowleri]KAF0975922.1 hypothetical protein FDP41_005249 [Naegleria fowleri]CAG4713577.1 unnamed protein product [Naegleria fowleri]
MQHIQELARIRSDMNDLRAQMASSQRNSTHNTVGTTPNRQAALNRMNNDLRALRGCVASTVARNPHESMQLASVDVASSQMINQLRTM